MGRNFFFKDNELLLSNFDPAQPFSNNQKNHTTDGGHPGIDLPGRCELPAKCAADKVPGPKPQPGQDNKKEQPFQATASQEVEGGAVNCGKNNPKDDGGKSHIPLVPGNYITG